MYIQGAKYGYLWFGTNLICALFFFFFMPELKGRTLEEIDELFAKRVSAWDFKKYQTTIQDEALAEIRRKNDGNGNGGGSGISGGEDGGLVEKEPGATAEMVEQTKAL